jgi:hypothetical protein
MMRFMGWIEQPKRPAKIVKCYAIEKADYASYRLVDPWEVES